MTITPGEHGRQWPSGIHTIIAGLRVEENWVANAFGQTLISGPEYGLGPWVAAGGILPSGEMVEVVKHFLAPGGPGFELRIDSKASRQSVLEEFIRETGLSRDLIEDIYESEPTPNALMAPAPTKRRRFVFSLRTLFLTVTACSLVAAWWTWNLNKVRQRDQLLRSLKPYSEEFDWGEWKAIGGYNVPIDSTAMKWLMFSRRRYYAIELIDGRFTTEDVGRLHALFPESEIWSVDKEHLDANGDNIRLQRL